MDLSPVSNYDEDEIERDAAIIRESLDKDIHYYPSCTNIVKRVHKTAYVALKTWIVIRYCFASLFYDLSHATPMPLSLLHVSYYIFLPMWATPIYVIISLALVRKKSVTQQLQKEFFPLKNISQKLKLGAIMGLVSAFLLNSWYILSSRLLGYQIQLGDVFPMVDQRCFTRGLQGYLWTILECSLLPIFTECLFRGIFAEDSSSKAMKKGGKSSNIVRVCDCLELHHMLLAYASKNITKRAIPFLLIKTIQNICLQKLKDSTGDLWASTTCAITSNAIHILALRS